MFKAVDIPVCKRALFSICRLNLNKDCCMLDVWIIVKIMWKDLSGEKATDEKILFLICGSSMVAHFQEHF